MCLPKSNVLALHFFIPSSLTLASLVQLPLATKLTTVLQNSNILGAGAYSMSFGVGEEKRTGVKSTAPLAYVRD